MEQLRRSERIARRMNPPGENINQSVISLRVDMTTQHMEVNACDAAPGTSAQRLGEAAHNTVQSLRSVGNSRVSVVSQRRLLEARAKREKIEIQRKELQIEKALVDARLNEERARLEAEQSMTSMTKLSVQDWVDELPPQEEMNTPTHVQHVGESDVAKLSRAITDAIKVASNSTPSGDKLIGRLSARDLPAFSGDPLEWLRFKNTYETTTSIGQYTDYENIARLQRCLQGEAWEAVAARLITVTSAAEIMKTLEMRFGRPELVIDRLIRDMKRVPKLTGMRNEVVELATKVSNCVSAIQSMNHMGHLHNPELVNEITGKLTEPLIYRWLDYVSNLDNNEPRLSALARYLMLEAERLCKAGMVEIPQKIKPGKQSMPQIFSHTSVPKRPVYTVTEIHTDDVREKYVNQISDKTCDFCLKNDHSISNCRLFQSEDVNKRWEFVCKKRLCFRCLSSRHRRDRCKSKRRCTTCNRGHHAVLHRDDWPETKNETNEVEKTEVTANVWTSGKKVYLKVLPVTIEGPTGCVKTYALLDEGSTVTLVERQIAEQIGADGPATVLNLKGAVGKCSPIDTRIVTLTLRSSRGVYKLDRVRTVDNLSLPIQSIQKDDLMQYEHLRNIPIESFDGQPKLLIGQDYWHLIVNRDIREGRKNEPVASLCRLGWIIHGFVSAVNKTAFVFHLHEKTDLDLHQLVDEYFKLESIGVKHKDGDRYSADERRAIKILDTKSKRIGDRWETGLLWRTDDVELPDNKRLATLRLHSIERSMDSDANFAVEYTKQVDNLLQKGYAEKVDGPLLGKRVWYLPHFGVRNPNKPKKLRMVFDSKSETKGVSLNSELLTGPDLLNSLIGILMRFRERAVAVTGDIREMFLQVKIIRQDQNAQCFLWRGADRLNPPQTYKMTSMTFGATSSPCTATYILRRNAMEFMSSHPRAAMAILKRHYVDDYLDSCDTEHEMAQTVKDVTMIHKAGGFDITGWASNKLNVLHQHARSETVNLLPQHDEAVERTLGLRWWPAEDKLGFDLSLKKICKEVAEGLRLPTKREMLKVIMSVFDPLGFLCPFLTRGQMLLQKVWRSGIDWDRQISTDESREWFQWLHHLRSCQKFTIPRCYGFLSINGCFQLHVFVDASETAYSVVAYLRQEKEVCFVAAKCCVAPLKCTTIPRLELQAALMGARLGTTIEKEQSVDIKHRFFWTDSQTVWWWIHNGARRDNAFVKNRLTEIDELTQPNEWRWLPGQINAADGATRSTGDLYKIREQWISGPAFLYSNEDSWPSDKPLYSPEKQVETVLAIDKCIDLIDYTRFSNWRRLVRTIAWVLVFIDKCRKKGSKMTPVYEKRAEKEIIKRVQAESFSEDIKALKNGKKLNTIHILKKLNPGLDENGIVRMKSRIEAKDLPLTLQEPIILNSKHYVTRLLIYNMHKVLGHHNTGTLFNELRQTYFIIGLRTTVRSMIAHCIGCKKDRGRCEQPRMGMVPVARLQHHCRPFTFCGIDFFGPMIVTVGCRHEKRWGAIFTCLNTRAVHIELASSLSTDSALLAIRRMASRRGYPTTMYSDNGTNFRGADRELQTSVRVLLSDEKFYEQATALKITWKFNPPDAAHMGGIWERLVRSVKVALNAVLHTRAPKEEILVTLMAEAENIVNSRPLTHVSLDPNEEESLTPNHFLLGTSNNLPRPGIFYDSDLQMRRSWRVAQRLTDHFWSRWLKEYLPTLQIRHRWQDDSPNINIGDLVIIADSTAPRNVWPRGKITATYPGRDGRVRMVDVATRGGTLRRPVTKLLVLLRASPASQDASA